MLNYLWAGMILVGIVYGILSGNVKDITDAVLNGAGEAISLCITMAGVMALWMGLMEIAKEAGLIEKMTGKIMPLLKYLFPRIPKGHIALEYIATNLAANILGLGWACTPAGLKAMEALAELERERGNPAYLEEEKKTDNIRLAPKVRSASDEMCTFLIINISSIQLIPVNMIAYRSQYGSVNPSGIVMPAIVATLGSALVGLIYCLIKNKTGRQTKKLSG